MPKGENCEVNSFETTSSFAYLTPTPIPESRHKIHKQQIYTGYHILENYDIHYVHANCHCSQLVEVEVDQVSQYNQLYVYEIGNYVVNMTSFFAHEQFLLQPLVQPQYIVCIICYGQDWRVDCPAIKYSLSTAHP